MLAEIYCWFTEGFEFADLKDAKALLEGLGPKFSCRLTPLLQSRLAQVATKAIYFRDFTLQKQRSET